MKTISILPEEIDRFWSKVETRSDSECWPWRGYVTPRGYGQFWIAGLGMVRAHRVAYQIRHGAPPDGTEAMHACDRRDCCNPGHLSAGTHAENMADMVGKGRQAKGETLAGPKRGQGNPHAKLTPESVLEIRRRAGSSTQARLAAEFGVSQARISEVISRKTWGHV